MAREHVNELAQAAREDVRQIRAGLPLGAAALATLLPAGPEPVDAESARPAISKARGRVQDLRIAKSTFFAFVAPDGTVVRNDQEQDRMAGKGLFGAFPALRVALDGNYVETRGSLPEAAEVRGRPDGQWVAAASVRQANVVRGLFVTGWAWSAYAYRLQNSLRSSVAASLKNREKMPLLYVYLAVDRAVYAPREAPDVNIQTIERENLAGKLRTGEALGVELEITRRAFGLGALLVPELGDKVAIGVLRSET